MKGRGSLLEERVPHSGRCAADGEDALSIGREDRQVIPLGGWESEVDQKGNDTERSHHTVA